MKLPQADIEEVQKLESAAITVFKNEVLKSAQTIADIANGTLHHEYTQMLKLRYDAATQIINRVLGPIKAPASDWVSEYLEGIKNTPETKEPVFAGASDVGLEDAG
jgi:hypothetical protein